MRRRILSIFFIWVELLMPATCNDSLIARCTHNALVANTKRDRLFSKKRAKFQHINKTSLLPLGNAKRSRHDQDLMEKDNYYNASAFYRVTQTLLDAFSWHKNKKNAKKYLLNW